MKLAIAVAAAALLASFALAAPCRDAKGHFIKCPPAGAVAAKGALPAGVTKDAQGRCHLAGGKFTACPK